jgi:hypothetical protein
MRAVALALACASLVSCASLPMDGALQCGPDPAHACPDGFDCVDSRCYRHGHGPGDAADLSAEVADLSMPGSEVDLLGSVADLTSPAAADLTGSSCAAMCHEYAMRCSGANEQYGGEASCNTYCTSTAAWTVGMTGDTSGDTVACRAYHAALAAGDPITHCPHAGPSGGNTCGAWCDVYCDLTQKNCTGADQLYASTGACMTACAAFATNGAVNSTSGNTVQCRIYFAGTPAYGNAGTHCPHASTTSTTCQ